MELVLSLFTQALVDAEADVGPDVRPLAAWVLEGLDRDDLADDDMGRAAQACGEPVRQVDRRGRTLRAGDEVEQEQEQGHGVTDIQDSLWTFEGV